MPKIKMPTPNPEMDKLIDEHIKNYSKFFLNLNESMNEELIKIKPLLQTGILDKNSYGLFRESNYGFEMKMALSMFRDLYIHEYGFFVVSEDFLKTSVDLFSKNKILEVGAGTGFLSACLQGYGLDITPTESQLEKNEYGFSKVHTKILEVDSVDYLKLNKSKFDTVLMSWPNYSTSFGHNVLEQMQPGQTLIYIGEGYGGCTADDQFFDSLNDRAELLEDATDKLNKVSFSWFGIHDRPRVYKIIK